MSLTIEQQAGKQAGILHVFAGAVLHRVGGQLGLYLVPQRLVDDRHVLAGVMLVLMNDLAPIDPVLQHPVQRAPDTRLAAPASARCAGPALAPNALSFELFLQQRELDGQIVWGITVDVDAPA